MIISLLPMSSITVCAFDWNTVRIIDISTIKVGDKIDARGDGVCFVLDKPFKYHTSKRGPVGIETPYNITFSNEGWDVNSPNVYSDDKYFRVLQWVEGDYVDVWDGFYIVTQNDYYIPQDSDDDHESGGSNDDDSRPAPPSPHEVAQNRILHELDNQLAHIDSASNGQVIIDGGDLVNALPNGTMVKIAENRNATIFFKFIYDGVKYTTAIPAGAAIDTSLDYYGPLYMMNVFPTMMDTETGSVPYVPGT